MKTLLISLLLAGSAAAVETPLVTAKAVKNTLTISVPLPHLEDKYSEVLISANGLDLDLTQIASNRWQVQIPLGCDSGEFSAVLCGRGRCTPVTSSWVAEPWNLVPVEDIQVTNESMIAMGICIAVAVFFFVYVVLITYRARRNP